MERKIHGLDSDIFCCCREIETLKGSNDHQAKDLLTRAANQVKSIMAKRKWRVLKLLEFYPDNPSLLGLNVNAGEKVLIRLRRPGNFSSFLSYNTILGTLLHELCHNVHGPHNQLFYNLLNEITQECELGAFSSQSSTHSTVYTPPQKLNQNSSLKPYNPRKAAAEAALKRSQYNNVIPQKSYRLGGGEDGIFKIALPTEMALAAAERRLLDSKWCGTTKQETGVESTPPEDDIDIVDAEPAAAGSSPNNHNNNNNRFIDNTNTQKPQPQTQPQSPVMGDWDCQQCTYINMEKNKQCEVCGFMRKNGNNATVKKTRDNVTTVKKGGDTTGIGTGATVVEWICSACTLVNGPNSKSCVLCGNELKPILVLS